MGENGSGKSTILDALTFGLFGKPFRSINKPQLVNSINGRGTLVEIDFVIGKNHYQIIRGIKPTIFEIKCNQQLINQDSHFRDYQEFLEKSILQFNYKSFTQVVILGSSAFVPFMQLKASDRRAIIEDLLDIQIFSKMNNILKERITEYKNEMDGINLEKEKINHQILVQNEYVSSLEKDSKLYIEENQKKITESELQIKSYTVENEICQKDINKLLDSISDYNKISEQKKKLDIFKMKFQDNIKKREHEICFYEENNDCPTCKQMIDAAFRQKEIKFKKEKIEEQAMGFNELSIELEVIQNRINDILKIHEQISEYQSEVSKNTNSILAIQQYVEKIQKELKSFKQTGNIDEQKNKLEEFKNGLNVCEKEIKKLLDTKKMFDVAGALLKDGGIKTSIVKTYLPIINKCIQRHLSALDFYISFELDENFDEIIRSRYRDDFSYSSFSEGEKMRIDLSLLFSWRQVAKIKNSMNTNLLILDEVFDSSLDSNGTDEFLKLIGALDEKTNTFIISHKGEVLYDKFRSVIKFDKKNNFSQIVNS